MRKLFWSNSLHKSEENLNKTIILPALFSLLILTGCTEDSDFFTPLPESSSADNVDVAEVYDGILGSLENMTNFSEYKGFINSADAETAMNRIRRSRPELFWADGYTVKSGNSRSEITINVLNDYPPEQLDSMLRELESAADRVISGISADLDDFGKIVYVHDYLINNTVYDHVGAESDVNGLWGTAYGCLVDGKAVCQGYSEAFQYIMNQIGIPCGTVTGLARSSDPYSQSNNGEPIPHAWNYVNIDGKNYWIDVTWDDPDDGQVAGSPIMHTYCLINDERMFRTRILDPNQENIPNCYSMDANYYVRNGTYIALYSLNTIGAAIAAYSENGEAELMFADVNVYNEAMSSLFDGGELWELNDYADISESVRYTNDDNMYVLKIAY